MFTTDFLIPIIALIVSVVSLFTDINNPKGRKAAGFLILLLLGACGLQIMNNFEKQEESKWQKTQITNLSKALSRFEINTGSSFEEIKSILQSFGSTNDNPTINFVKESLKADRLREQLIESTDNSSRKKITVQYFPKNVDRQIVEGALRELNFNYITGESALSIPTNAIWFGNDVPIEDVKLVAYTLIRAGVEIRAIRPFYTGNRNRLIQVGSGTAYQSRDPLSVDEIQAADKFTL